MVRIPAVGGAAAMKRVDSVDPPLPSWKLARNRYRSGFPPGFSDDWARVGAVLVVIGILVLWAGRGAIRALAE